MSKAFPKSAKKLEQQSKARILFARIDYDPVTPKCSTCRDSGHPLGKKTISWCVRHDFQNSGGGLCRDWNDKHTGDVLEEA